MEDAAQQLEFLNEIQQSIGKSAVSMKSVFSYSFALPAERSVVKTTGWKTVFNVPFHLLGTVLSECCVGHEEGAGPTESHGSDARIS